MACRGRRMINENKMLTPHLLMKQTTTVVPDLMLFVLKNNYFHFNGIFYHQKRGLAMGSKLSPVLAILVMDRLEKSSIFQDVLGNPLIFLRYIDDCVLPVAVGCDKDELLRAINLIHPTIKFQL